MGIGISVFLLAVGAILYWAVTGDIQGVDLDIVGIVLMVAGGIGLLWALVVSSSMPWRRGSDDRVVHVRSDH
ncbi:MAG: DUF6458 family protein [Chloroflexota bacterium]|nr:DUF6458 family protein [Chloroflexota bacterium]